MKNELAEKIVELRKMGYKYKEISEILGVSMKTVRKWLNRYGLTKKTNHNALPDFWKLSWRERGYIIGLMAGDGGLKRKKTTFETVLYLNSKKDNDVAEKYITIIKKINLRFRIVLNVKENKLEIEIASKPYYLVIKSYLNSLNWIRNREFILGYIEGLIDSDGNVYSRNRVRVSGSNPKVMYPLMKYLTLLGIKYKVYFELPKIKHKRRTPIFRVEFGNVILFKNSAKILRFFQKK